MAVGRFSKSVSLNYKDIEDSRSFLTYARHEHFRRILCNLLDTWVENAEYPADEDTLGDLAAHICCHNAIQYYNL